MGYLHNPTDISENSVIFYLKVPYNKNWINPICENCVILHNLSDCVNGPWRLPLPEEAPSVMKIDRDLSKVRRER
jgi:hypothetical protein